MRIAIKDLKKEYKIGSKTNLVLDGIDQIFNPNGKYIISGPSGAGKSTLLRILAMLDQDYEGKIFVDKYRISKDTSRLRKHRRRIGYVFQEYALLEQKTVMENVLLALEFSDVPKSEHEVRVLELLDLLGIVDYADIPVKNLSGGERQRTALARSMVYLPEVLILDEPFNSIDNATIARIAGYINKEFKNNMVIFSTHQIPEAMESFENLRIVDKKLIAAE